MRQRREWLKIEDFRLKITARTVFNLQSSISNLQCCKHRFGGAI